MKEQLGNVFELQKRILESEPLPGKRVLFVGDRESLNFESFIGYANEHSEIQPAGLIAPGGELDRDIISIADRFANMRSSGTAMPIEEANGSIGFQFRSVKGADFSFEHAPYEAKRLREEEEYRREYCLRLVAMAQNARPDLIFLSNFKVILDPVFVKAFEGKIVNVHPSVLPLIKGFRPEKRADQGEESEANGYTMHLADTNLDGGPTIFQQYVPLEPKNPEKEDKLGKKEYDKRREEAHRLKIIQAQALWSPQVLALVSSNTPRKIVSGDEAFAAEGRPNFAQSKAYQRLLEKEYAEWKERGGDAKVIFEEWKKQQKSYSRILFDKGNGWQTAETILGAPKESDKKGPDIISRYSFKIPGDSIVATERFGRLTRLADKIREERGMSGGLKTGYMQRPLENPPYSQAYIELPYDMQEEFTRLIDQEMNDVTFKIETKPTNVTTPRIQPLTEETFDV